jgi:tRNA(Ile)-lysidine synthase
MLSSLCAVNGLRDRRWLISVAHLDHKIRTDSSECAEFVGATSDALGLECRIETADVRAIRQAEGGSLEETARRVRYEFLARAAEKAGASVVAVAHHADDQAETVLHRVLRGTGVQGLAGMRRSRPIVEGSTTALARPLLGFRRSELRDYLQARGLTCREDVTNDDVAAATRNRIRHELLPQIEKTLNPQAVEALVRLADQADEAARAMVWMAGQALAESRVKERTGEIFLKASSLAAYPGAVRSHVVRLALAEIGAEFGELGQERMEAAVALADRNRQQRRIELPGGVVIERRGEYWIARNQKTSGAEVSGHIEHRHL